MKSEVGYDSFAEIYDIWLSARPIAQPNLMFYVDELAQAEGTIVELGTGTGRIAIEVAKRGRSIVAIDASKPMLDRCAALAAKAGVSDKVKILQADFRDFSLPQKASLITLPFHGIGHLLALEEKKKCLRHIHDQLLPGGRLIFDHFILDLDAARRNQRLPKFRREYVDPTTGNRAMLWAVDEYDFEKQTIRLRAWTELLDARGVVTRKQYYSLDFSWAHPDQFREILKEVGFEIKGCFGDYQRGPLKEGAKEQVWSVYKK